MIVQQEVSDNTVKIFMQVERECMYAFALPENVMSLPFKGFVVLDEHGNKVSGYDARIFAEYIEVFPAIFPKWVLQLTFELKGIQE